MQKNKRVIFLIFLIFCVFLISKIFIKKFLLIFPYFKIEEIEFKDKILDLNYLKGISIFSINLKSLSKELSFKYPEFKEIILNFQFPSKLNVEIKEHMPIAKLILNPVRNTNFISQQNKISNGVNKEFFVDEEGRILTGNRVSDIPEIIGLQNKIIGIKIYKKYNIPELLLSLDLIKRGSHYEIKKIYANKKEEITILLNNGLRVKIGDRDYPERLETLSLILREFQDKIKDIDYVDLRFKDPIVKYK